MELSRDTLQQIAAEYGTPVYVYHAEKISEQYNKLTQAFSACDAHFFYACKSLTNINVLKHINSLGANLDCVSINEVQLGLLAGFDANRILYTPNCVDFEEILEAKALGVNINIDNISMLERFGNTFGDSYPICIRVNPHIMAGGNVKISTGHIDSKFGISIYQIPHILRIVENTKMHINGIHMHTGSDILDIEVFLYAAEILFDAAKQFKDLDFSVHGI